MNILFGRYKLTVSIIGIILFALVLMQFSALFPTKVVAADADKIINHANLGTITQGMIETVNQHNILFEHASVGANVIDGLSGINAGGVYVDITAYPAPVNFPGVYDYNRGNPAAQAKVDQFVSDIIAQNTDGTPADDIEIAAFKWCYIDEGTATYNMIANGITTLRNHANSRVNSVKLIIFTMPTRSAGTAGLNTLNSQLRNLPPQFSDVWVYDIQDLEATRGNNTYCINNGYNALCNEVGNDYTVDGYHPDTTLGSDRVGQGFFMALYEVASGGASPSPTPTPIPCTTDCPLYRFWSDQNQGHFYTSSVSERDTVINNYDDFVWRYEGIAFTIISCSAPGASQVYRFWSDQNQHHFYTISDTERNEVINNYDDFVWRYEGIVFCAYQTSQPGSSPVYRFWSDQNQTHFYTINPTERDLVINNYDDFVWKYEGVAYYAIQ